MSHRSSWETTTHNWDADLDIEHLAEVRARLEKPYLAGGSRHLILEILAYANDEAKSQGRKGFTTVTHLPNGWVTVADDGRGTDTRRDTDGIAIRKPVMATPDVRFTPGSPQHFLCDGLPRRGMSTVTALSSVLVHENYRENGSWSQTYRFGIPDRALASVAGSRGSGTVVTFRTDIIGPAPLTEADAKAFGWLDVQQIRNPEPGL